MDDIWGAVLAGLIVLAVEKTFDIASAVVKKKKASEKHGKDSKP